MSTVLTGRDRKPPFSRRPKVYIAGKIGKNDFRHDLVPKLRGHEQEEGELDCGTFEYVGPFFRSCDHGCSHGPGSHGAGGVGCDGIEIARREVYRQNRESLEACDLIVVYIESADCHGTLIEIGLSACAGKSIQLIFAPGVPYDDFWFASQAAQARAVSIVTREDLPEIFHDMIAEWGRKK
jgi:hypothetical protein